MKTTITAPWTEGEETYEGVLGMVNHFIKQLKYFQKQNDTEHIRRDIQGYEMILKKGSQDIARKFMEIKQDARTTWGLKFKDNIAVIEHMKSIGEWDETPR